MGARKEYDLIWKKGSLFTKGHWKLVPKDADSFTALLYVAGVCLAIIAFLFVIVTLPVWLLIIAFWMVRKPKRHLFGVAIVVGACYYFIDHSQRWLTGVLFYGWESNGESNSSIFPEEFGLWVYVANLVSLCIGLGFILDKLYQDNLYNTPKDKPIYANLIYVLPFFLIAPIYFSSSIGNTISDWGDAISNVFDTKKTDEVKTNSRISAEQKGAPKLNGNVTFKTSWNDPVGTPNRQNNKAIEMGEMAEGVRVGTWYTCLLNGDTVSVFKHVSYKSGESKDGISGEKTDFSRDGDVVLVSEYRHGNVEGWVKEYITTWETVNYNTLDSSKFTWMKTKYQIKDSQKNGLAEEYAQSIHDETSIYVSGTGHYLNGEKTGTWEEAGEDVGYTVEYLNGKRHGKYLEEYYTGSYEGTYSFGEKNGKWVLTNCDVSTPFCDIEIENYEHDIKTGKQLSIRGADTTIIVYTNGIPESLDLQKEKLRKQATSREIQNFRKIGQRGILEYDKVNLRREPSLQARVVEQNGNNAIQVDNVITQLAKGTRLSVIGTEKKDIEVIKHAIISEEISISSNGKKVILQPGKVVDVKKIDNDSVICSIHLGAGTKVENVSVSRDFINLVTQEEWVQVEANEIRGYMYSKFVRLE